MVKNDLNAQLLIQSYKDELTALKNVIISYKQETKQSIEQLQAFIRSFQGQFEQKVEEEVERRVEQIRHDQEEAENYALNINLDLVPRLERLESRAEHLNAQLHIIENNAKKAQERVKIRQTLRECFKPEY